MKTPILSMTGFGSIEGEVCGQIYRIEVKSVNHRFLDLKVRLPRELQSIENNLKSFIQSRLGRGAIEFKVERLAQAAESASTELFLNLELAKKYSDKLQELNTLLGLRSQPTALDLAQFPDVLVRSTSDTTPEDLWKAFEPLTQKALTALLKMREHEGTALVKVLVDSSEVLEKTIDRLREKRAQIASSYPARIRDKIKSIFEAYPLSEGNLQAVLESRISQELALLADRTDIEEELVRFHGHLQHLRKVLSEGGQVGRKLDFVLQELNREINTLGNKAQDYGMSEEVVATKVRLEQLREQVMNLE